MKVQGSLTLLLLLLLLALCALATPIYEPIHISLPSPSSSSSSHSSSKAKVLYETTLTVPKATFMRIFFSKLLLPEGTHLVLTSLSDGAQQHLDGRIATLWRLSSAIFNGDSLLLQVIHAPHPLQQRFPERYQKAFGSVGEGPFEGKGEAAQVILKLREIQTDLSQQEMMEGKAQSSLEDQPKSICYNPDTRIFSNDTKQGRYIYGDPNGCCTAWLIDDANHCFLSAGHCTEGGSGLVEFNVPLSADDGTLVHPPPEDQYIIDQTSMQTQYSGNSDWRYFGVFSNSETALHPIDAYSGEYYKLQKTVSDPPAGANLRITGFGENEGFPSTHRRVLKTATGPFVSRRSGAVSYRVDTSNGNSGSAIFNEDSGFAIGIHTLGGCRTTSETSSNSGVDIFLDSLQKAIASPLGVCAGRR